MLVIFITSFQYNYNIFVTCSNGKQLKHIVCVLHVPKMRDNFNYFIIRVFLLEALEVFEKDFSNLREKTYSCVYFNFSCFLSLQFWLSYVNLLNSYHANFGFSWGRTFEFKSYRKFISVISSLISNPRGLLMVWVVEQGDNATNTVNERERKEFRRSRKQGTMDKPLFMFKKTGSSLNWMIGECIYSYWGEEIK